MLISRAMIIAPANLAYSEVKQTATRFDVRMTRSELIAFDCSLLLTISSGKAIRLVTSHVKWRVGAQVLTRTAGTYPLLQL